MNTGLRQVQCRLSFGFALRQAYTKFIFPNNFQANFYHDVKNRTSSSNLHGNGIAPYVQPIQSTRGPLTHRRWMALPRPPTRQSFFERIREEFKREAKLNKDLQSNLKALEKTRKTSYLLRTVSAVTDGFTSFFRLLVFSTRAICSATYSGVSKGWQYFTQLWIVRAVGKGAQAISNGVRGKLNESTYARKLGDSLSEMKRSIVEKHAIGYGGYKPREVRLRDRARRLKKDEEMRSRRFGPTVAENPNAGSAVVITNEPAWKETWGKLKSVFSSSETADPDSTTSDLRDRLGTFFSETETAIVVKAMLNIDPSFNLHRFLQELQEYMVPEVLDAMNKEDMTLIRQWCSERICLIQSALIDERRRRGLKLDSQIIDLRKVDLLLAKMIEGMPMLYVVFETQEIELLRDRLGKIVEGREDIVSRHRQIWVFTCNPENISNPVTNGWRVVDAEIQQSLPIW